ncbi:MAG: acyl transferase [Flavobacteriales bacterium]|nr:acyl transferase [Flavobacteriales bacterium]
MNSSKFIERLFTNLERAEFEELALELFRHQSAQNEVYRCYLEMLKIDPVLVKSTADIPYLPIEFFKSQRVVTGNWEAENIFHSSGTSETALSRHEVKDASLYRKSFVSGFKLAHGKIEDCILFCLLPNYQDNQNSSLIYMADELINLTNDPLSGYYLERDLEFNLLKALTSDKKVILLGVSYALLDLAGKIILPNNSDLIVMETGGMKGTRKELIKEELHKRLKEGWGVSTIHSEYGMTELLSQAYSKSAGVFNCPPWMRVSVRDVNDPLKNLEAGQSGGINIIDLANVYSCAFIATQDLGKVHADGTFELLGRFDHADIRGCNLLVADN